MSFATLPLDPYVNSVGATYDAHRKGGQLNAWGNAFPAEELPFGGVLTVAGIPFLLPAKGAPETATPTPDIVEPLGQRFELPDPGPIAGLAFLCCGEMGDQWLRIRAERREGEALEFDLVARGFTVDPASAPEPAAHRFTHLHYPGDYDLGLLTGALWCAEHRFAEPVSLTALELGVNPLSRIAGLTLLHPD